MAKKPAKAKEAEEKPAEGEGGAGAGKRKLLILGGAGLAALLVAGGGGAWWFGLLPFGGEHKEEHAETEHAPAKTSVFLDLPEMTVNIAAPDQRATYLRVKIALELANEGVAHKIEPVMPRVLDSFQVYLRELRVTDLDGSAGMHRLKEELARRINVAIAPSRVDAVLFKEILIQ